MWLSLKGGKMYRYANFAVQRADNGLIISQSIPDACGEEIQMHVATDHGKVRELLDEWLSRTDTEEV